MKKILSLIVVAILYSHLLFAQKTTANALDINVIVDSMLYGKDGFKDNKTIVGAAVGIYWQGKTYYFTYGYSDNEKKIKVNNNTMFEIGSNTKVFTGFILSTEIAKGKIDSNDYIDKYVEVNEKLRHKVKITDIANHISGLPTFHDSESLAQLINKDTTRDALSMITDEFSLKTLRMVDTLHNYGKYEYSNFAVGMLGYILQKREYLSYDQLLQQTICKPLGMTHTTTLVDSASDQLAKGYWRNKRAAYINLCNTMQGAGAIKSNIVDMMKFIQFQLQGNSAMNDALAISHKKYYNGEHLQIAMGWHIGQIYGTDIYEMRGDTYGASSMMFFDKQNNWGAVVLLNSANSGVAQRSMSTLLAKVLDNTSDFQKRFARPEIVVNKKILDTYAGMYELEPGFDGTVTIDGNKLCLQLTGQPKGEFKSVENNWFTMEKYNCQLEFVRKSDGSCDEMIIHQNGNDISCKRKVAEETSGQKQIKIPAVLLLKYTGEYMLAPDFTITIRQKDGNLFAQATGQSDFQLYAETETMFYAKVAPIKIEFIRDNKGTISKLILHQGGEDMPAVKK